MDKKTKLVMAGGAVLAIVVATVVSFLLARQPATTTIVAQSPAAQAAPVAPLAPRTAPVLVAVQHIPSGTAITAANVGHLFRQVTLPVGSVQQDNVFASLAQLTSFLAISSHQTLAPLDAGEQLSTDLLLGVNAATKGSTAAQQIPLGYDAVTLVLEVTKAVNGVIAAHDRVDVIYSVPVKVGVITAGSEPNHTATLIQGALVLSAQPISNTYTLAISPQDSVRLAHVEDAGWSIHLALRSSFDGDQRHVSHQRTASDF